MVSSTFKDLENHRAALIGDIQKEAFAAVVMENDTAKADVDVVDSSLQMVRDAAAYIVVIGMRYGQTPVCPIRNPDHLSITELEFNEAQRIGRPILLFIMGEDHTLKRADWERDPVKEDKLNAFRERAKKFSSDSLVNRIYATFNSLEEFKEKIPHAVAGLRRYLEQPHPPQPEEAHPPTNPGLLPAPPAFYAEPRYAASHKFVGRASELTTLSDWASPADPYPILLFDAIGGTGKSMLTWEWTTNHATKIRTDWAGRLWYSFYERGAIMADFCRHALAYITQQPLDNFKKLKPPELSRQLLLHLQIRPFLLVLDGLERVLVAYNRNDAAELSDEEASNPTDRMANRDPCTAIHPQDDDLLRAFTTAAPSKILITTRLPPRALLNTADQTRPGVSRVQLMGLRPPDAEALFRSCGIKGDSPKIQAYLQTHCDCHPLTTGVLAGLIQHYLSDRGNFNAWATDPDCGGHLNLADLDLRQKRNHILKAAIAGLSEKSRQLLSTLALLSGAADYPTLSALNPHIPPEPEEVEKPLEPVHLEWQSKKQRKEQRQEYEAALQRRSEYEQALEAWPRSPEYRAAAKLLEKTVHDLQSRGLLQYDDLTRRYDLHPVVRGVAAGGLRPEEKDTYGQRAVDYFSAKAHNPYEQAETLEDVQDGINIVRILLKMGRYQQAFEAYQGDLSNALLFNLEATADALSLLRPFFPLGWTVLPKDLGEHEASYLTDQAGIALRRSDALEEALTAYGAVITMRLQMKDWRNLHTSVRNLEIALDSQARLASAHHLSLLDLDFVNLIGDAGSLFMARLHIFVLMTKIGAWEEAQAVWNLLDPMGRDWSRSVYRPGYLEFWYARLRFYQGDLTEQHIALGEKMTIDARDRLAVRDFHALRGEWHLGQREWALAVVSLQEAVSMARAVGRTDAGAETNLALAQFHLGQLSNPREEAERLAQMKGPAHRPLAELWLAIGDQEQARKHATEAYKNAWADGEPYVYRYQLSKSSALLERLGADIPQLPPYDPASYQKFPWEDDLVAAIEKLRAEKEAEAREEQSELQTDA